MGYPFRFRNGIYACASEQYVTVPNVGVRGPYAAGIPPIVRGANGRKMIQVEEAVTNALAYSRRQDLWISYNTPIITLNVADPVGGLSACTIEDNDAASQEYIGRNSSLAAGIRVFQIYVKYNNYRYYWHDMSSGDERISTFDFQTDTDGAFPGYVPTYYGHVSLGSWKLLYLMYSDAGAGLRNCCICPARASDLTHQSVTPVGIVTAWEPLVSNINHIPSIITTGSDAVTKAKSEFYFPAAKIPAMLRKRFSYDVMPYWSTAMLASQRYQWQSANVGAGWTQYCYIATDGTLVITDTSHGDYIVTSPITFAPFSLVNLAFDADAGTVTVSGAAGGNGTYTGTAWPAATGDLWWGMGTSAVQQFNGCIGEPIIAWN